MVALLVAQHTALLLGHDGGHVLLGQLALLYQIRHGEVELFLEFFLTDEMFQNPVVNAPEGVQAPVTVMVLAMIDDVVHLKTLGILLQVVVNFFLGRIMAAIHHVLDEARVNLAFVNPDRP